jgi:hypothetical protein
LGLEESALRWCWKTATVLVLGVTASAMHGQALPNTSGETLSGKSIVLANAIRGHAAVLVVGFSKDAGDGCGDWAKAMRGDPALSGVMVYQVAMLGAAPAFIRGVIKSAMRKGMSAEEQDRFVVLTQEEPAWRSYFGVNGDKEPYVVLMGADGRVRWRGHGAAKDLEAQLRRASGQ